ncbi:MAG: TIGR03667 family PPOX class F420-dependent oxidoreductase [Chloroflexi bacterium]|nr:TIGR03667 family PPOX class F420-dependent oxidoreductase [Chloroflexota bacterium]
MLDLNTKFGRLVKRRLKNEQEIWLTTVDKNGIPQLRPVWFFWDGETFLLYSQTTAHKLKHIARNPNVVLHFNSNNDDGGVVVFHGTATVDPDAPAPTKHKSYFRKYKQGIQNIQMTPEQFDASFSTALRVTPTKMRGW